MRHTLVAAVAAIALLVVAGTAAAQGAGFAAPPADDRPLNGTYNPWTADDWRLDRIQARYDLTDEQVATIQDAVETALADGATPLEIRAVVHDQLEAFGIEVGEPLGPGAAMGPRGFGGQASGYGPADDRPGFGMGGHGGMGGFGLRDGSCMS